MKKNMSKMDAIIRIGVALAIVLLWYMNFVAGPVLIVLGVVAVIFTITGFINFCPLYAAFKIRTRGERMNSCE